MFLFWRVRNRSYFSSLVFNEPMDNLRKKKNCQKPENRSACMMFCRNMASLDINYSFPEQNCSRVDFKNKIFGADYTI